eukprot:9306425-Ditylum_brightwellii.AAC.1
MHHVRCHVEGYLLEQAFDIKLAYQLRVWHCFKDSRGIFFQVGDNFVEGGVNKSMRAQWGTKNF